MKFTTHDSQLDTPVTPRLCFHCTGLHGFGSAKLVSGLNRSLRWGIPLLLLVVLAGCQSTGAPWGKKTVDVTAASGQPAYNVLQLNYETTDFSSLMKRLRPSNMASSLSQSLQLASAEQPANESFHEASGHWTQARIQIVYPHPDGSPDKGLARLIVTRKSPLEQAAPEKSWNIKKTFSQTLLKINGTAPELVEQAGPTPVEQVQLDEEVWQLDLAREELDMLLSELSHRGFFEQQERPRGEAVVTVKLDEGAVSKRWTSEPRLEDLMLQVYKEGELTAFQTRTARTPALPTPWERLRGSRLGS